MGNTQDRTALKSERLRGLLLQEIRSRRLGCFFFQSQMHALVATILLGVSRFDPLDSNTVASVILPAAVEK